MVVVLVTSVYGSSDSGIVMMVVVGAIGVGAVKVLRSCSHRERGLVRRKK